MAHNGTLPRIMAKRMSMGPDRDGIMAKRTARMSMGPDRDGKRPKTEPAVETNTLGKKTQEVRVREAWRAVRERKAKLQEILRSLRLQRLKLQKDQRRLKQALFGAMSPLRQYCFAEAREILKQEGLKCAVCGRKKEHCFDPQCASAIGLLRIAASYNEMPETELADASELIQTLTNEKPTVVV